MTLELRDVCEIDFKDSKTRYLLLKSINGSSYNYHLELGQDVANISITKTDTILAKSIDECFFSCVYDYNCRAFSYELTNNLCYKKQYKGSHIKADCSAGFQCYQIKS